MDYKAYADMVIIKPVKSKDVEITTSKIKIAKSMGTIDQTVLSLGKVLSQGKGILMPDGSYSEYEHNIGDVVLYVAVDALELVDSVHGVVHILKQKHIYGGVLNKELYDGK